MLNDSLYNKKDLLNTLCFLNWLFGRNHCSLLNFHINLYLAQSKVFQRAKQREETSDLSEYNYNSTPKDVCRNLISNLTFQHSCNNILQGIVYRANNIKNCLVKPKSVQPKNHFFLFCGKHETT